MPITEASGSDLLEIQKLKEKNTRTRIRDEVLHVVSPFCVFFLAFRALFYIDQQSKIGSTEKAAR
jgi:hypothetical protein